MDDRSLLVSIHCLVYNHEPFLRQCLDGFVMQQTNFRFEAVVHDDVSTDGSADIIREYAAKYPDIIKPIFETENQYSKGTLDSIMFAACTGKYIAFCEGDDYWTDPFKLQKQVDFLESHPDYSVCFHSVKILNTESGIIEDDFITRDVPGTSSIDELGDGNYIHTLSVVVRSNENANRQKLMLVGVPLGDYPMWVIYSQYGKIYKLPDCMGVYRFGVGIWSKESNITHYLYWLIMLSKLSCIVSDKKTKQVVEAAIVSTRESIAKLYYQIEKSKAFALGNAILRPFYYLEDRIIKNRNCNG